MKSWLRIILFIAAFQVEVRVKAAVIEMPEACLKGQINCAVKVIQSPWHFKAGEELSLHASKSSVLERKTFKNWNVVKGELWVEKANNVHFETVYGDVTATQGEFWILTEENKVWIRNMSADLTITLRDGKQINPPEGFQLWIAGLNSQAKSDYGIIEPIDMKNHIPLWNKMFPGTKEEFIERVVHCRDNWGDLVERSSEIYKALTLRQMASEEKTRQGIISRKKAAEQERQRIREQFRARVFDR